MVQANQSAAGRGWRLLARLGTEVRPREGRLVLALFGHSFLLGAFQIAAKSIRQSSFVDSLGYERLPYVYLVVALCAYPLVRSYSYLAGRISLDRLVPRSMLFVIAGLACFWWLFGLPQPWIRFVFYIWISIITLLAFSQFWTWVAEVLDSRQARRLYAFILSGQLLGGVAGGQIARLVADAFGSRATLIAGAALLGGTFALVPLVLSAQQQRSGVPRAPREAPVTDPGGALGEIARSPHLRAVTALMLISIMVAQITDLQFNWVVERSTQVLDQRTGVYGNFFSLVGLVAFALQLLVTARVHRTLGVGFALRILPTSLALGSLMLLGTAALAPAALLWTISAVKLGEGSLRYSLDQGTRELLFVPVPPEIRPRVKAFIDVFVQRFARAMAAILLLGVTFGWITPVQASWVVLALSIVWWGLTVIARRHYVATFREGLLARRIDPEERLDPSDITTLEVLVRSLGSTDPRAVLHAIDLLTSQGRGQLIPPLLLYHDDAQVRRRTLEVMRELGRADARPLVEKLVADDDEDVRVDAVRTLAALSRTGASELMAPRLRDPDPRVRAAAIVCLAKQPEDDEEDRRAQEALDLMLRDERPEVRTEAARALGSLSGLHAQTSLIQMLTDADLGVVRAAVASVRKKTAAEGVNFMFVPILISLLRERRLKHEVREALADCGEAVIPALIHFMNDPREFHWVRRALPKTIARFGGEAAATTLLASLVTDDVLLRHKIIEALVALHEHEPQLELARDKVSAQIRREARLYLRAFARLAAISEPGAFEAAGIRVGWVPTKPPSLLQQLLLDRMAEHAGNLFGLLALVLHHEEAQTAYAQLRNDNPRQRSLAIEYLDNALPTELRRPVLAVIDDLPLGDRLAEAAQVFYISQGQRSEVLRFLVEGADDTDSVGLWLGAAALSYIDEEQIEPLYPLVEAIAARSRSPLLRETALWILDHWARSETALAAHP